MKILLAICPLFALFAACKSPTFTYIKEVDHKLPLIEFKVDTTFELYTRSICKDSRNFPIDCDSGSGPPVEVGYIILSNRLKKVLVINNVPNRNQKFFDEGVVYEKAIATDTLLINVFFFKQFRFGTLQEGPAGPPMNFASAEKHPRIFRWNYKIENEALRITSVANVLPYGEDVRDTESSLYLVPTFKHSKYFKFVFQLPSNMTNVVSTNKSVARIFVHKKSKKNYITYIEFERPVYKDFRAIKFAANRMYAFSSEVP
jgi:hypothetical protein